MPKAEGTAHFFALHPRLLNVPLLLCETKDVRVRVQIGDRRSWAGGVLPKERVRCVEGECRSEIGDPGLEGSYPRSVTVPGGLRGIRVRVRVQIGEWRSWAGGLVPKEHDCAWRDLDVFVCVRVQIGECRSRAGGVVPKERDCAWGT